VTSAPTSPEPNDTTRDVPLFNLNYTLVSKTREVRTWLLLQQIVILTYEVAQPISAQLTHTRFHHPLFFFMKLSKDLMRHSLLVQSTAWSYRIVQKLLGSTDC
jgi:hypothetical protein